MRLAGIRFEGLEAVIVFSDIMIGLVRVWRRQEVETYASTCMSNFCRSSRSTMPPVKISTWRLVMGIRSPPSSRVCELAVAGTARAPRAWTARRTKGMVNITRVSEMQKDDEIVR